MMYDVLFFLPCRVAPVFCLGSFVLFYLTHSLTHSFLKLMFARMSDSRPSGLNKKLNFFTYNSFHRVVVVV